MRILENLQYTGCTVNFKTSFVSFKVKKKVEHPQEEWQIIPDTQEAIIDMDTFERVQELRYHRRRNTATGRTSLFSGLVYCADCGSKLYFCASKSIKPNQEFHRCSAYKENRGTCSIHYIREVVLKEIVLEAIQKTARYVQNFEPVLSKSKDDMDGYYAEIPKPPLIFAAVFAHPPIEISLLLYEENAKIRYYAKLCPPDGGPLI